jgi:hypothetical protein
LGPSSAPCVGCYGAEFQGWNREPARDDERVEVVADAALAVGEPEELGAVEAGLRVDRRDLLGFVATPSVDAYLANVVRAGVPAHGTRVVEVLRVEGDLERHRIAAANSPRRGRRSPS